MLLGVVLLGAALRLYRVDHQSIWWDEASSLIISQAPAATIKDYFKIDSSTITRWLGPTGEAYLGEPGAEFNPPVYFYALHGWFRIFGYGPLQARLLSVTAGVLCLPMLFVVTARLFDKPTALTATLFLAVSQLGIMYSQEARNYELLLLLFLFTLYLYLVATSARRFAAWCGCTVCAILMIGTHYYGGLAVIALAVYTILYWRQRSVPWRWIGGSVLAGAVALLPWFAFALPGQLRGATAPREAFWFGVSWSSIFDTINRFNNGAVLGFDDDMPRWSYQLGGLLFTVPVIGTVLRAATRDKQSGDEADRSAIALCCILALLPVVAALLLGSVANVQYDVRYVAFCIVPYYMLLAAGVCRIPRVALRGALVLAILAYSGYALRANYYVPYKENYRDAVAYIAARATGSDCYAFVPYGAPPLGWTIYTNGFPTRLMSPRLDRPSWADCPRIWVITYTKGLEDLPETPRWKPWLSALQSRYTRTDDQRFYWIAIERYGTSIPGYADKP